MAGLGIGDLPWPEDRYRIDLLVDEFETTPGSDDEARLRSNVLRIDAGLHGGEWGSRARELADRLDPNINPGWAITPADPRYMRDMRIRFTGAVLKLLEEIGHPHVRRCDVIRPDWNRSFDALPSEDPKRLKNEFRSTLVRTKAGLRDKGIDTAGRFIIAALHGDFEPEKLTYQLHFHMLEEDENAIVVDNLRDRKGFISPKRSDADDHGAADGHVATPVRVRRKPMTNQAYAVGYLLKSYWLQYPRVEVTSGSKKLKRKGQRIDAPFLSHQLLWMDTLTISDLILLIGLRVTREGLVPTRIVHE